MGVVLFNYSEADFTVKLRDRVIQIIVQAIATQEVPGVEDLDTTVRRSPRWRTTPPSGVPQGGGPRRFVRTSREVV
ncbi:unnamed protein product [Triticum turgidum subsp. durum]|uniref:dUTP diphosphatase n=1 Tax=Triticum turgidum subsp. durum TaxID=4567 RepID=A0A9R0Q0T3_TRITD|nr:unnamed protein product [Triticum turgidum subsp. durum]